MLLTMMATTGRMWGQSSTMYTFNSSIPTTGWTTSGGSQTINSISWSYSSSTYIGAQATRIQIGSKNNPQTSAWTIQTPVSSFGNNKKITAVSITAYTTATTATYDISAGGSSVKSGSLTTSSSTYTANNLNITSGNIVITMTGSSTSKAMYLSDISVTYEDAGSSSDPSITASDVNITYDATEGSIAYTLNNATGNVTATLTTGDWLTLGTVTSSAVPFTCTANDGAQRTATVTLSFEGAQDKVVTVTQASAPVIYTTIPAIYDAATSTETNVDVTFGDWVVSGVRGSSAYVTDNIGNGFIIFKNDHGFAVNNKLSGTVTETPLKRYNGSAEFTNLTTSTTGLNVSNDGDITVITNKTIAELGGVNTGAVIKLSGLTYDGTDLSDGTNTIKPYNSLYSGMSFTNGKIYNVTGVYLQYNSTKEIMPRSADDIELIPTVATPTFLPAAGTYTSIQNVTISCATEGATIYYTTNGSTPTTSSTQYTSEIEVAETKTINAIAVKAGMNASEIATAAYTINLPIPTITVAPAEVNASVAGGDGTLSVTYDNITTVVAEVYFCTSTGDATTYDWIVADINNSNNIEYIIEANTGAARTAYLKVHALDDDLNDVYSNLVTINQAAPDYATLPFNWGGGVKEDLLDLTGVTTDGLGDNYGSNHNPYNIKFDNTNDYIQVKTDSQPSKVTIGVKMIGGASTSKITVKASADGITFDDGEELTISGTQNDILNLQTTRSFGADVRFVRMVFTKGSNVGVGPITITKYTTDPIINAEDVNIACDATNGSIAYTISNPVDGGILTAAITAGNVGDWLTLGSVTTSVAFTCTANTEEENRTATVTLTYTYNTSETVTKDVTVTQSRRDFALLPFSYDGNGSGVLPCGLTQEGVGTYSSAPKMKFDGTGDNLILKLNETPVSIIYDIKGNSFSDGTFNVQVSTDGITYNNIKDYTALGDVQTDTLINNNTDVRYIKWIYTNKSSGNVALGNIQVYDVEFTIIKENATINNLTIANGSAYVVDDGVVLTLTGTVTNTTPANLIIEDGGQLVLPENATVQATVKKAVGHAAKSTGDWYTISSPVNNIAPGDVTNLIQATATNYDFYYYNEPSGEWFNHKAAGHAVSNMTNGRGYLYWNAGGEELAFAGELNTGNVNVAVTADGSGDLAGINLIGNPYSHNIYKGDGTAIPNAGASLVTGFYVLSNSDSWVACTDNTTAIKPGQGILVKTTTGGTVQMTNTTSKGTAKAGNDNIRFTVANNQYEDVAYALFKNEIGLDKINHRNAEVPMLYIPQDGINYAIATMSDDVEMFTLSFKTVTTSKYTLSVKLDGRYDYLHIIDRLTGEDVDMLVEGEYSFMGTPKDLVDRFIVKLKYDANINDVNDIFAYQSGSDVIVNGEGELQIFDLMGRKVMTQTVNGVQTVNVPAQGVYIFRLNGKVQKIVVK